MASAKIEGRLRTPEYVAAAVSACLAGREGRAYDRDLLKNAFSRSGFTSGYLDGKIDGTMFGVRSEADAELTKKTLPACVSFTAVSAAGCRCSSGWRSKRTARS